MRTAFNVHNQNFYLVHGVYCEEISGPLTDLVRFLDEHPKEVVILDFQHFYDLQAPQHQQLINIIMHNFHSKLFKRSFGDSNLIQLNLNFAYQYRKQIVVIYRNNLLTANEFFKANDFPTPWPNATNIDSLKEYLEKILESRLPYQGFVTQCVLTPDANFIIPRFYSTLKKKCAKKVDKDMSEWISELNPGNFREGEKPKVNVILADFVDIHDNKFSKIVVDLNAKLENRQSDQTVMRSGFKIWENYAVGLLQVWSFIIHNARLQSIGLLGYFDAPCKLMLPMQSHFIIYEGFE